MYSRVRGVDLEYFDSSDTPSQIRLRDQSLGKNVTKSLRQTSSNHRLFVLRIKTDDAIDRLRSINRVQGGEHEMSCLSAASSAISVVS